MAPNLNARLEELAQGVLGPLVLGGTVRLVPPFGAEMALALGEGRRISDDQLRTSVDVARVRRARLVAPIDVLPDISPTEWALVAALNDLLQATNHELSGPLTRGRHQSLFESLERLFRALGGPRTTLEVIVRHATFARLLEIERTDTHVRAWAGSITYRGQQPEKSMTFWPGLRRVVVDPRKVPLSNMPEGFGGVNPTMYQALLSQLLARSPLTDLATLIRPAPIFAWSVPTLELVSYPTGRSLAIRALSRAPAQLAVAALKGATGALAQGSSARGIAESFTTEVVDRVTSARA